MRTLLAAVFLAAAGPLPAIAADCAAVQRSCRAQCEAAYAGNDAGRAGCAARCGWDGAACTAQRALDDSAAVIEHDVQPWLADQADRWQRFLDGFKGNRPAEPPRSKPAPGIPL
jgi:hypothetical protein